MQIPYEEELCALADAVWETPEPGFREYKSSAAHVEFLKKHGFEVKTDVAKTGTGYEASWGSGHPVIAFLGEFDALYGMNQKADCPSYHPEDPDGMGQGCGHHMLGVGAIAAGMAYREMLKENGGSGTVKIFGCPGEESGSGKAYMRLTVGFMAVKYQCHGLRQIYTWYSHEAARPSIKHVCLFQAYILMQQVHHILEEVHSMQSS